MHRPVLLSFLRPCAIGAVWLLTAGCGDLKNADVADSGPTTDDAGDAAAPPGKSDAPVTVVVDTLVSDRSRLGARSAAGQRPWRSGIAANGDSVFWVESGTSAGLYSASASTPCTSASCVTKLLTLARPSAFAVSATHVYFADTTTIKRFPFAGGTAESIVSHNEEIVNLATADATVFWTAGSDSAIRFTAIGGATNTPIHSNGTPIAMAVAGNRLFWAGVDISGQSGAMQQVGTNGSGAREVSRFSAGFHTMRGNGTYLYYAKDDPGSVHRITLNSDRDELIDKDALGVTDFAIDDTHAYWVEPGEGADFTNGRVRRVAHDSKAAETLAVGIALPLAIAVSGKRVYVASAGTKAASYADGKILRLTIEE